MKRKTYTAPATAVIHTKLMAMICSSNGTNVNANYAAGYQNASNYAASREGGHWDDSED